MKKNIGFKIKNENNNIVAYRILKKTDKQILNDFYNIKLGNREYIDKYCKDLADLIKREITEDKNNYILLSHPSTTKDSPSKMMTDILSKILGFKKSAIRQNNNAFKNKSYYKLSPSSKIKEFKKYLFYERPCLKNKHVIIVDDAILTGSAIKSSMKLIDDKFHPKSLQAFVCFYIDAISPSIELDIISEQYKIQGEKSFLRIVNNKENIITSKTLYLILSMPKEKAIDLLKKVKTAQRRKLLKQLLLYSKRYDEFRWFQNSLKTSGLRRW